MNLLVQLLRSHVGELPYLDPAEDVPFRLLETLVAADERLGPVLRAADADPLISEALSSSFAGAVRVDAWDEAREIAKAEQAEPGAHSEWVTIIPVPERDYGVTLPDDLLPDQRVSLFTRAEGTVRRVSVVVIPGERPTLELRMAGGECGFPYRGVCGGGSCQHCRQAWVGRPDHPAGYVCRCDDPTFVEWASGEADTSTDRMKAQIEVVLAAAPQ
jgi:hypothetical protein